MTLQEIYYIVAAPACVVSVTISLAVFVRNRPDKIKTAVSSAIEPLISRMDEIEATQEAQGQQLNAQDTALAQIRAEQHHGPSRSDIDTLHNRITDLVRGTAEIGALAKVLQQQQTQVNQFLMERGRE